MTFKDLKKRLFTATSLLFLLALIFISDFFFLFSLIVFSIFSIIEDSFCFDEDLPTSNIEEILDLDKFYRVKISKVIEKYFLK